MWGTRYPCAMGNKKQVLRYAQDDSKDGARSIVLKDALNEAILASGGRSGTAVRLGRT
jgi:hypothetical protein